jgi:hypothetical protein
MRLTVAAPNVPVLLPPLINTNESTGTGNVIKYGVH